MQTLEQLKTRVEAAVEGARVEIIPNGSPANPASLLIDRTHGRAVAKWLRDDPETLLDYASNVTGVDWPEKTTREKAGVKRIVEGVEKEVEETVEKKTPGCLEAVYHLYSMALKHGPLVVRLRTENRSDRAELPSLTPIWRSCELQEREVFDLFGIQFQGHPDLRRILMWDGFADYPMRKDYVPPADEDGKETTP